MKLLTGIATVAALVLAGCVSNQELGQATKEITEQESDLVFNGPGLEGGYRQIIFGYVGGYYTRRTLAFYGPQQGEFPYANIVMLETSEANRYFPKETLEESIESWTRYTDSPPQLGETVTASNKLGAINFAPFQDGNANCLVFSQVFGTRMARGARNLVAGHYCRLGSNPISEAEGREIVAAVGHRDYGAVPLVELQQKLRQEIGDLSGEYILNWSGVMTNKKVDITFLGREKGSISFHTLETGACEGNFSLNDHMTKGKMGGVWAVECAVNSAFGEFSLVPQNDGSIAIEVDGSDPNGGKITLSQS